MNTYTKFLKELRDHPARGYHVPIGPLDTGVAMPDFAQSYIEFLKTVGPGFFFAGALKFYHPSKTYPPHLNESVHSARRHMASGQHMNLLPIGDCGVFSEILCVETNATSSALFLYDIHSDSSRALSRDFHGWVEAQPRKLFRRKSYKAFGPVKDPGAIERITEERRSFQVQLLAFDKDLVRPPGQEADFLPRHTRIVLRLEKCRDASLDTLTISVFRAGSEIGIMNREFISIDVSQMKTGESRQIETFAFDPFNLPFDDVQLTIDNSIDLTSPTRVRYKEIASFL